MSATANEGLCSVDFTGFTAPTAYYDASARERTKSGQSHILFIRCDADVPDATDIAALQAMITAGTLICTPPGIWSLPEPTITTEIVSGCGEELETNREYLVPFRTVWTSCTDTDVAFWSDLDDNSGLWRVILLTCDDAAYLSDAFYTAIQGGGVTSANNSMGLEFSFSKPPYEERAEENETFVKWNFELKIKKTGSIKRKHITGISSVCP